MKKRSAVAWLMIVYTVFGHGTKGAEITSDGKCPKVEDIISKFAALDDYMRSMKARYAVATLDTNGQEYGTYVLESVHVLDALTFVTEFSHGRNEFDNEADPRRKLSIYNGADLLTYFPFDRTFSRGSRSWLQVPDQLRHNVLFIACGFWPFESYDMPKSEAGVSSIMNTLRQPDCRVLSDYERRRGVDCVVVEWKPFDTIWIDWSRKTRVVAREIRNANGSVLGAYDYSGHEQVGDNLWFPKEIHSIDATGARRTVLRVHSIESAKSLTDDGLFRLPPGALEFQLESPGQFEQSGAGGLDLFDEISRWCRARNARSTKAEIEISEATHIIVSAVIGMLVAYYGARRTAASSSSHGQQCSVGKKGADVC